MGLNLYAEVEHAKFRDTLIEFLNSLGKLVPNPDDFSDVDLGNYIVETLREQELADI